MLTANNALLGVGLGLGLELENKERTKEIKGTTKASGHLSEMDGNANCYF